jgi:hydroxyethylthiazole kinase-like uncharacterized protein yjeF
MTELLTAARMRAIEREAIESGVVTGLELMERAGAGVVEAVLQEWPELVQGVCRAVVLCGPGNNGGDGFVVSRLLKERGWEVEVFLYGDPQRLPPDARVNHERWCALDAVLPLPPDGLSLPVGTTLVIDALFGTGMSRPLLALGRTLRDICDFVEAGRGLPLADRLPHHPPVAAVDLPSGLCADSGRMIGPADTGESPGSRALCAAADLTITFHALKQGHVLAEGPRHCGKVRVVDIGLHELASGSPVRVARARVGQVGKRPGHKYDNGHSLVLSGGAGRSGAARLAARGALRVGTGLVTLGVPGSAQMECAAQVTAVMLRRVEDGAGLAEVLADARLNALCLGPGLGLERARALVPVALGSGGREGGSGTHPTRAIVLDADALTAFEDAPERLFEMLHDRCVLTPHGGEFARLFPDLAKRLREEPRSGPAFSKVDATREAAARAGCVVLFKGPDTVIAAPAGQCSVNAAVYDRAAPWLATAGAGDVLAGMICGLMARGFPAMQAAETAAWLHVECARSFGPGLIAEDLPEALPKVFRALGL